MHTHMRTHAREGKSEKIYVKRKSEKSFSRVLDTRIPVRQQNGFEGYLIA